MTGKYRRMKERVKGSLSYWIGLARSEFAADLHRFMAQEPKTSRAELARKLNTSPAYITKVLNDTAGNFTLETMAKLARAMDTVLHIRLAREGEIVEIVQPESFRATEEAVSTRAVLIPTASSENSAWIEFSSDFSSTVPRIDSRAYGAERPTERVH